MGDIRKAAEMALEFIEWFASDDHSVKPTNKAPEIAKALRQALAQSEWAGLTDEEIGWIWHNSPPNSHEYARAIEAKLKEKNCG